MDKFELIRERFQNHPWHDSRILSIAVRWTGTCYIVTLDVLFTSTLSDRPYENETKPVTFNQCRLFGSDLDLLGMQLCGGMIGAAQCYEDVLGIEKTTRNKVKQFGLPDERLPLDQCYVFEFELIHPSGIITIFAKDFESAS